VSLDRIEQGLDHIDRTILTDLVASVRVDVKLDVVPVVLMADVGMLWLM
jgi:hypothetical protein